MTAAALEPGQATETEQEPGGEAESTGARPVPVPEEKAKASERVPEAGLPSGERKEPMSAPVTAAVPVDRGADSRYYDDEEPCTS